MWVRLNVNKTVMLHGAPRHYLKGDWIDMGGLLARQWIAAGEAVQADPATYTTVPTAGILARGAVNETLRAKLSAIGNMQMSFADGGAWPTLPFTETLLWTPEFEPRLDLIMVGFNLLKKWQIAVPLVNYETLACHVGTDEERAYTQGIIRDLRVPLRDPRLVFIRRSKATQRLIEVWRDELQRFGPTTNEHLALLRAIYTVKPVVCDLPNSWTNNGVKR